MILPVVSLVSATTVRRMGHSKLLECTNWGEGQLRSIKHSNHKSGSWILGEGTGGPMPLLYHNYHFFFYQTVLVDVEAFLDE